MEERENGALQLNQKATLSQTAVLVPPRPSLDSMGHPGEPEGVQKTA